MITTVVNLFGGPGCGKSSLAAEVYAILMRKRESAELVREYVKDWAHRGDKIGPWDQLHLLGEQLRRESCLYGKVETIITDSPLFLCAVYEEMYTPGEYMIYDTCEALRAKQRRAGIRHIDMLVTRAVPYVQTGRYESETDAHKVDLLCRQMCWERSGQELLPARGAVDVLRALGKDAL